MIQDFDGLREVVHFEEGLLVKVYRNDEAEDYPPHWHSDIEIILPLENGYTVKIDERQFDLGEGDILVIPPGVIHELFAPKTGLRLILLVSYGLTSGMNGFYDALRCFYPCLHVPPDTAPALHATLRGLLLQTEAEFTRRGEFFPDMMKAAMRQFLVLLARSGRCFSAHETYRRYAKSVDGFLRVCDFIRRHCAEPLTIERLAEVAGYSKSHFLRMFKEFANSSCGEYVQHQRVIRAKELLADPERCITEIVTGAGFGSVASFNRVFKEQMGCTPTEYRKRLRSQNRNI